MSERAKIRARRVTGNSAQQQRVSRGAIRIAREMALLPYVGAPGDATQQRRTRPRPRRPRRPRHVARRRPSFRRPRVHRPEMAIDGALGASDIDELLVEDEAGVLVDESGEPELEIEALEVVEAVEPAAEETRSEESYSATTSASGVRRATSWTSPTATPVTTSSPAGLRCRRPTARPAGRVDAPATATSATARARGGRGDAEQLEASGSKVAARAGDDGKLFGSITAADIVDAVQAQTGVELDGASRRSDEPIKELGRPEVPVRLHADVEAILNVEVVTE